MIFATYWFFFSVALLLPIYWLVKSAKVRVWILISYCMLFHMHFAGPAGVAPIIVLATITFLTGRTTNRALCLAAITVCTLALCHYKYSLFFLDAVFGTITPDARGPLHSFVQATLPAIPPLAISFFTFEFVHYLIEVRKNKPAIKSPMEFLNFTFFFPTLVAGPIKRYQEFLPAWKQGLATVTSTQTMLGLLQVTSGYMKKLLLADNLSLYIESREVLFHQLSLEERWIMVMLLHIRVYFDFSGYSDIAIGLARMMGIEIPANFNWPLLSMSVKDFWRRWHISLSSWIRDYIYIPLAGGRQAKIRKVFSAMFALSLCGLWHGAAWNFVVWGLYHGTGLTVNALYRKVPIVGGLLGVFFDKWPIFAWLITFVFCFMSRLLFFYPLHRAVEMFCLLFTRPSV